MDFKERLVLLRKEQNLSQKDFAEKMGYSRTTISAWEIGRNKPSYDDTVKMADFFNVSTDFLLGKSEVRNFNFESEIKNIEEIINARLPKDKNISLVIQGSNKIEIDTTDLSEEDIEDIYEYAEYIKEKRKKNKNV